MTLWLVLILATTTLVIYLAYRRAGKEEESTTLATSPEDPETGEETPELREAPKKFPEFVAL